MHVHHSHLVTGIKIRILLKLTAWPVLRIWIWALGPISSILHLFNTLYKVRVWPLFMDWFFVCGLEFCMKFVVWTSACGSTPSLLTRSSKIIFITIFIIITGIKVRVWLALTVWAFFYSRKFCLKFVVQISACGFRMLYQYRYYALSPSSSSS